MAQKVATELKMKRRQEATSPGQIATMTTKPRNIGTLNVHELFWMLQCNFTKGDESTFFVLNVDRVFVRNWVLLYINESAKRSAASILMLYIHFPLSFPVTFGAC